MKKIIIVINFRAQKRLTTRDHEYSDNYEVSVFYDFREDFNKKNSKKSEIVAIRSGTYLPYLNSDIKFSDICSKTFYLPTPRK